MPTTNPVSVHVKRAEFSPILRAVIADGHNDVFDGDQWSDRTEYSLGGLIRFGLISRVEWNEYQFHMAVFTWPGAVAESRARM